MALTTKDKCFKICNSHEQLGFDECKDICKNSDKKMYLCPWCGGYHAVEPELLDKNKDKFLSKGFYSPENGPYEHLMNGYWDVEDYYEDEIGGRH